MAQVNYTVLAQELEIAAGDTVSLFWESVSQTAARVVTVVPRNPVIDGFIDNDQLIEVVRIWHILKGAVHERDGTGGTGDLQLNVEIRNLDEANPGFFDIYMGEIEA